MGVLIPLPTPAITVPLAVWRYKKIHCYKIQVALEPCLLRGRIWSVNSLALAFSPSRLLQNTKSLVLFGSWQAASRLDCYKKPNP
jgi:hypothetical protein